MDFLLQNKHSFNFRCPYNGGRFTLDKEFAVALPEKFDAIVFGGGKGGKSLAMSLAPTGLKVALIERGQIGGSCINVACIPTKSMVASAKVVDMLAHAGEFGVHVANSVATEIDHQTERLRAVIARKRRVVKNMVDTHWTLFTTTTNMELIVGEGRFVGPKQIEVLTSDGQKRLVTADRIFINTGSRTAIPAIDGLDKVPYLTSTSVMELDVLPAHLAIIGGGYIALEFAQIFRRLGSAVTVLLRGDRFLPNEDADIAAAVKSILEEDGICFKSNAAINNVATDSQGSITVNLQDGESLKCSHLLLAIGRIPNTDALNLESTGVAVDARGNIKVNTKLETVVDGIWALGDCNGGPLFTHVSWDDYRIVKENVLHGGTRTTDGRLVPYTLFIDPELGRVGLTEEAARQKGLDILVARLPASKIPRANTSGENKGLLKAVVEKASGQILGCSLFCHSAGEVMSVVQMAMIGKVPYKTVRNTIFTHPTMAESLNLLFATI